MFINLTPHPITICGVAHHAGPTQADVAAGDWTLPPSGGIARCAEHVTAAPPIAGIPTSIVVFGAVDGLPQPSYEDRPTPCAAIGEIKGACPECGGCGGHVSLSYKVPTVYYVVSLVVAQAARAIGRTTADLLTPGQQVRDETGRVTGCRSLARVR